MGIVSLNQVIESHFRGGRGAGQLAGLDQAQQERLSVPTLAVVQQFVLALIAPTRAMHQHVLQFDQPRQMTPQLGSRPNSA